MYNPIGRGFVQGGVFKTISSTVNEQDEWTAVMTVQYSATVSPILGYKTSLDDTFQWASLRPCMNIFTLRLSRTGMTMATITDKEQKNILTAK
jgi:hypothetical protein